MCVHAHTGGQASSYQDFQSKSSPPGIHKHIHMHTTLPTHTQGHSYCAACLQSWRARSPSCPECRRPALHSAASSSTDTPTNHYPTVRNLGLERVIQRLLVRCCAAGSSSYPPVHCEWTGPLEALAEHREKACAHRLVACRLGCGWIGRYTEEEGHVLSTCTRFERTCRYGCGQSFGLSSTDDDVSPEQHYRALCPMAPVPCPFARFGCEARPLRREMGMHHQVCVCRHAGLLVAVALAFPSLVPTH